MDPVSAVGLASSILTFVDFAWNLVGGAVDIYRSVDGILDENARLDHVKDDLDYLCDLLAKKPTCRSQAERKISRIAEGCRTDSKALKDLLKEISVPNNGIFRRSLRVSWMSIKRRKDISELKARLQEYRSDVLLQVTLLLREEQSSLNLGIAKLRDDCSQLKIGFRTQITSTKKDILGAIEALEKSTGEEQARNGASLSDISQLLANIQTLVHDTNVQHRILRQLVYEDMNSREHQIPEAAENTYKWTLEDRPVYDDRWHRHVRQEFLQWLRAGDGIFHISGNPGSGKSTLMKFLSQDEKTRQELQAWAATNTLIFAVFYFWNPGSKMQRTLAGLYRSLLFQALSQCPELTEEVFPVQFKNMKTSTGDMMVDKIQSFGEIRIEEGFELLRDRVSKRSYRMCFFIDGLDECEGNRLQHEKLAESLQAWVASDSIKICFSSRPYSEFIRPLGLPAERLIQLHKLNNADIRTYCLRTLERDIYAQKKGHLCRRLVEIIVEYAQGVFLWAHLVIDVLLVGFRQDDPDRVLEGQLHSFPSDLDKLYAKLRESIEADPIQRTRANRMLLLAARNPFRHDLTAMAFSWLEGQECDRGGLMGSNFPPATGMKPYSKEEIAKRLDHVSKQIDGLARGFLEVVAVEPRDQRQFVYHNYSELFFRYTVRFCHKTAKDYLLENQDRRRAILDSFPNFEESEPYAKISLAETIHGWHSQMDRDRAFSDLFPNSNESPTSDESPTSGESPVFHNSKFLASRKSPSLFTPYAERPGNNKNEWHSNLPAPPDIFFDLDPTSRKKMDPDLIARCEIRLREFVTPCVKLIYDRSRSVDATAPSQVSFVAYAAYCGLDRFVIRKVGGNATSIESAPGGGSILLSALEGSHHDLISTLLAMGERGNELCVLFDHSDSNTEVKSIAPACVIAISIILRRLIEPWSRGLVDYIEAADLTETNEDFEGKEDSKTAEKILSFSRGLKISMWATLQRVDIDGLSRTVRTNAADAVQFFAKSPRLHMVERVRPEPSSPRAEHRVKESRNGEEGKVDDDETPGAQVVNELFKSPIHQGRISIIKFEWSTDSQDLVELKGGCTRLF